MKKISIIVPVYNVDSYLERMLKSILNQTFKNLEIILIDDGSTDNSRKICDLYKKKDNRIKVIHKINEGVSAARNLGIKLATGDYIGFVDSDDIIDENMYQRLYDNLIKTKADISCCNYVSFKEKANFSYSNEIKIFTKEEVFKDLINDCLITNFLWNKLFKKSLFKDIKFPVGKIYEDLYVMPSLIAKINLLVFDNSELYGYFKRSNSYVNTYNDLKNRNYLTFCNHYYNSLLKYEFLENDLAKYRILYIYTAYLQAAKSRCFDIFKADYMLSYYQIYKKNYHLIKHSYSLKRRLLCLILYISKNLFYLIVCLLRG